MDAAEAREHPCLGLMSPDQATQEFGEAAWRAQPECL